MTGMQYRTSFFSVSSRALGSGKSIGGGTPAPRIILQYSIRPRSSRSLTPLRLALAEVNGYRRCVGR